MKPKRQNLSRQTLIISGSCMCKKLPSVHKRPPTPCPYHERRALQGRQTVEERPFRAALEVVKNPGFSPRLPPVPVSQPASHFILQLPVVGVDRPSHRSLSPAAPPQVFEDALHVSHPIGVVDIF